MQENTNIEAKIVGRAISLHIDGMHFYLNEADVRRLRAEMNRVLQKIAEKRR